MLRTSGAAVAAVLLLVAAASGDDLEERLRGVFDTETSRLRWIGGDEAWRIGGQVNRLEMDPTGRVLLSCGFHRDQRGALAVLWNVDTRRKIHDLVGHEDVVHAAAFSSDGSLVATGSRDRTVRIWEVGSGRCIHVLRGHTREIGAVAFSADDHELLSGSEDGTLRLYEVCTGRHLKTIEARKEWAGPHAVALHPGGRVELAVLQHGTAALYDLLSGERVLTFCEDVHGWGIIARAFFLPDGERAVIRAGGEVQVRDARDGRIISRHAGLARQLKGFDLSVDGSAIALAGEGGEVVVQDLLSGRTLLEVPGSGGLGADVIVALGPEGQRVVVGTGSFGSRTLEVVENGDAEGELPSDDPSGTVRPLAFDAAGYVAVADASGRLTVRRLADGRRVARVDLGAEVLAMDFAAPPAGALFVLEESGGLHRLDLEVGTTTRLWATPSERGGSIYAGVLAASPSGDRVAWSTGSAEVQLLDPASPEEVTTLEPPGDEPTRIAGLGFGPEGTSLHVVHAGGGIVSWDLGTGEVTGEVETGHEGIWAALPSSDGRRGLLVTVQGGVTLWSFEEGRALGALERDERPASVAFDFSPAGDGVLFVQADGFAKVLDLPCGAVRWETHAEGLDLAISDAGLAPGGAAMVLGTVQGVALCVEVKP